MSDSFSVDTSDLLRLVRGCEAAAKAAPQELGRAMTRSVLAIEGDAKGLVPVDTGNLRRSITHDVSAQAGGVVGRVGTNVPYARYVEEGTSPHWPPVSALAGWAGRHGIPAFLVARAISRRGTKAKPYLKPALQKNLAAIDREFHQVVPRILAKLAGR
jgi:HK97 gp10 family phage protein